MKRILVVDDQKAITELLVTYLVQNGFEPIVARDGEDALAKYEKYDIDLILLDIMMPKKDGYEVLQAIRNYSSVPIIMVTAKGEEGDRVMGLDYGADDYIVKPFSPKEVIARINAILRRVIKAEYKEKIPSFRCDDLEIYPEQFLVKLEGREIPLTKKELEILWIMATHKNKVFSRDELLDLVWGYDYYGDMRTVDTHMKRLRGKLGDQLERSWRVKTIWGVGYQFETDEKED